MINDHFIVIITVWAGCVNFKALTRHVLGGSVLARLDWPGLTGLIHIDDAIRILLFLAEKAPPPGRFETYFAQAEALSLAAISRMVHEQLRLQYRGKKRIRVRMPGQRAAPVREVGDAVRGYSTRVIHSDAYCLEG